MGWMISVGRAGAAKGGTQQQALSMRFDTRDVAFRLQVGGDKTRPEQDALAARQAQRVWGKVLATVVGLD